MDPTPGFTAVLGNIATIVKIFVEFVGVFLSLGKFWLDSILPLIQDLFNGM